MKGVRVVEHASAAALLAHAGTVLERSEAENGLVLGLLASPPANMTSPPTWSSVDGADGPIGVAMRTPPFNLLLTQMPSDAMEPLARAIAARGEELPGVTGPVEAARAFAERWARTKQVSATVTMRQGVYELTEVVPPDPKAPGALRHVRADEVDLVASWMAAFAVDAHLPVHEREVLRRSAAVRVASGGLYAWDHGGSAVSMASLHGATAHGIRVGFVYTPPELRGRGYASACVAAVSERALASGKRFCTLYTDLANPTSNSIYQRVGYRRIGESVMIAFGA